MVAAALTPQFGGARRRLIEELQRKGIRSLSVLKAFDDVPRHEFVPSGLRHRAYEDAPLPIGHGQTISQPWVHAKYLELLELTGDERVLEIGTGSGFQTALLTRLARHVFTVERLAPLAEAAREALRRCGSTTRSSASATARWAGRSTDPTTRFSWVPPRQTCRSRCSSNWHRAANC